MARLGFLVGLVSLVAALARPGSARAQQSTEEAAPRPFARGSSLGGAVLGLGTGGGRTDFVFGGSFGTFVLDGVAPGLGVVVTASTGAPTRVEVAPVVRVILYRGYPVSPFLVAKAGRLFVNDLPDLWLFGGGGGIAWFATPRAALTLEVVYLRYANARS